MKKYFLFHLHVYPHKLKTSLHAKTGMFFRYHEPLRYQHLHLWFQFTMIS